MNSLIDSLTKQLNIKNQQIEQLSAILNRLAGTKTFDEWEADQKKGSNNENSELPFPFVNVDAVFMIDAIDRWTPLTLKIFFTMCSTMRNQEFMTTEKPIIQTFCDLFKVDEASVIQSLDQLEADNVIENVSP